MWANESVERLNQLHAMLPDQVMYPLMKAQAPVINHQKQEAEWILEEFKREWPDHHTPEWGYYLYIMTLLEREPAYVDRMTHEIEMIFMKIRILLCYSGFFRFWKRNITTTVRTNCVQLRTG